MNKLNDAFLQLVQYCLKENCIKHLKTAYNNYELLFNTMEKFGTQENSFQYKVEGTNIDIKSYDSCSSYATATGLSTGALLGAATVVVVGNPITIATAPVAGFWGLLGYTVTTASLNTGAIIAGSAACGVVGGVSGYVYSKTADTVCRVSDVTSIESGQFSIECIFNCGNTVEIDIEF